MNTTTTRAAALVLAALLGGCAVNQIEAADALNKTHPIRCANKEACDRMWLRLQTGADEMTAHKFMERTATRLRQYAPEMSSVYPFVFLATREDAGGGSEVIQLQVGCMNVFGCNPRAEALALTLREHIERPD